MFGEVAQSRIRYRGSTAHETVLRPNTGSKHGITGIPTLSDEKKTCRKYLCG